ncbi:hypothetical protein SLS59_002047 [Nothophoma quercina]|uniref:Uncharacterized protein n=1 Tax=Nothophoma quercina TaxID=749835 RepID=A0ABR3RWP3_9PLEO
MPNGTLAPPSTFYYSDYYGLIRNGSYSYNLEQIPSCLFNYQGSNDSWEQDDYTSKDGGTWERVTYACNETVTLKVNEEVYDIQNLNGSYKLCYNNHGYDQYELQGKSRCLPDTANPSYQWGFSTMLSGIFVFIHFGWCLSMYVVWLDAQIKSTLIQEGYEMTPLRAAFAIAKAVKRRTGLEEGQLVRHNTKDLNKELYGTRKVTGTKVDYSMFVANAKDDAEDQKASPDSKDALKVLLAKLITDMDYASKLHDMYSAALMMYSFPVQGVVDGIKVSGVHCVCIDCMEQNNVWMTSTRAELLISASGVLDRVEKMSITFKKVEIYLFREWEKSGTAGFQKVINALPGTEDLKEMTFMKKVFPRQVKEMSAVEHSSNTKTLLADRPVNVDQKDDGKYDSGCETFP